VTEQPEQGRRTLQRQERPHAALVHVPAVAAVAGEAFVAAVARQRDRNGLARELAHAVGRHRRTVGVGLVVKRGERVDEAEIVRVHLLDVIAAYVAISDHLRVSRLVESRVAE
jgi:hypothetical protein